MPPSLVTAVPVEAAIGQQIDRPGPGLDTSVPALFLTEADQVELPGARVSSEDYRGILISARHDAPLDGVEELIVAVHDIAQVLSRPALARLAKIGGVAEQVAGATPGH